MKILVTGGAGFIGSNFVYYELDNYPNDEVICLDKLTYAGNLETLEVAMKNPKFKFVKGDIADRAFVDELFASGEDFYKVNDEKAPQNVYGKSKLDGELAVQEILDKYFIVRISWVFGSNGKNFIKTMLNLAKTHDKLTVVNDQIGSPTYTVDLAKLLCDMALSDKYGIYHATNEGICSWYDFACEIFKQADIKINVKPVPSTAFPTKAIRPHNSRMSKKCLDEAGFNRLPIWQDALVRYLQELNM